MSKLVFDQQTLPISKIIIGDRFRKDLGNIDQLVSSIQEVGLLHPVVLDESYNLIAGERRIAACKKLEWKTIPVHIVNLEDLVRGEFHENYVRKNFTGKETLAIKKALEPRLKQEAEEYKISRLKQNRGAKLAQREDHGKKSRDVIADYTGYSHGTINKMEKLEEAANNNPKYEKLWEEASNGNLPVDKAFKELNKQEKKSKYQEAIKQTQINLPETVQLHNQKFQDLKLKPNSVSLIFTDPPYEEKSLYLYKDLAKQAAKVLRDGGSLMCYAGHFCIDRVIEYMKDEGLKYHWIIAVVHSGPSASVFGRKILVGYKPLLWFTKGKYEGEFVKDLIKSEFQGKELHEWAQSTVESDYYIKYLTLENDIVYDPFLGQGTFGISTVKLKRQFIGCEINKQHFENAQRMISIANKS